MRSKRKQYNKRKNKTKRMKGGLLSVNSSSDLVNTHLCKLKEGVVKELPAEEIFTSVSESFELTNESLYRLQNDYRKSDKKWFKFVIFKNDNETHLFVITGGKVNKHSVCMLEGLLQVTKDMNEYSELRQAYFELIEFKKNYTFNDTENEPQLKSELNLLMNNVNVLIDRDIKCMPVIAAGSGTVNDDGSICINDKSGHYKPTDQTMEMAGNVFREKTNVEVKVTKKVEKDILKNKYGNDYENFSGICI
jgi:hypothetical protein